MSALEVYVPWYLHAPTLTIKCGTMENVEGYTLVLLCLRCLSLLNLHFLGSLDSALRRSGRGALFESSPSSSRRSSSRIVFQACRNCFRTMGTRVALQVTTYQSKIRQYLEGSVCWISILTAYYSAWTLALESSRSFWVVKVTFSRLHIELGLG